MGEQVAVLVHGAALDRQFRPPERHERGLEPRRAVDDHELRPLQTPGIEVGEECARPRCFLRPYA